MSKAKMKLTKSILSLIVACVCFSHGQYMESYNWSFQGGNLVSNWSFENLSTEICQGDNPGWGGTQTTCHYRMGTAARSGNYAMKVIAKNEGDPSAQPFAISQISEPLMIEPSTQYTFSFFMQVNWSENIASSMPVACWLRADKSFIGCSSGQTYKTAFPNNVIAWTPYNFSFTTASDAQYLYFHMVQSNNDGVTGQAGDTYYFDDLQIRKSSESPGILESRSYANAAGRVDHTIASDGQKDIITKQEYDALGRPSKLYLPVTQTDGFANGSIVVSALNLTGELIVDFSDLQTAYGAIAARVAGLNASVLPASITFYIVVASPGDDAPFLNSSSDIVVMKSLDGVAVPFEIKGLIRGSSDYIALAQSRAGQSAILHSQGPFTGDLPTLLAQQYPGETNLFKQTAYPAAGVNTIAESSLPGTQYGPGNHAVRSGSALLTTPTLPATVEYNSDAGDVEATYTYTWSRDPQGKYSAQITDERGLLVKSATADAAAPTSEADWIISRAIYDDLGRQDTSVSPSSLRTSYQYNGQGQMILGIDPDRGMSEVIYDSLGRTRFSRSPDGRSNNYMVGTQYDVLGRVLGTGRVNLASTYFTQANADNQIFPGVANLNQGSLYDALEPITFQEATGSSLNSLGFTPPLKNGQGREVVTYNRNLYAVPPGSWTQAMLLVATFHSYDSLGRLQEMWKYIGAAPSGQQWHKFKYAYDLEGRLASATVFNDQSESQIVTQCNYVYDANTGRVTAVDGKDGNLLTQYSYDFLGRTTKVGLPGNMEMDYSYDVQNKPLSVTGLARGKNVFQEVMGYESAPNSSIVNNMPIYPRFDGGLSSLIRKFSSAAPNPVEWWRYSYDMPGRMLGAFKHLPSSGGTLASDGSLTYPVTFNTAPAEERDYNYSDDGAVQSQADGAQTYVYNYTAGTHQINAVSPNLPGRTTSAGSFVFDANGRLQKDNGTGKTFLYNFADRPVRLQLSGRTYHFLYDENDNRVATLDDRSGTILGRNVYLYESGLMVAKEIVHREAGHPDGAIDVVKYYEYGKSGLVAESYGGSNDKQILLKDHQGSVMMTVKVSDGGIAKEQGYAPYGSLEQRVVSATDQSVSEAYTGKEWEDASGLYYFGARWYDPAIGSFISPDAAEQFFNPYSFSAGNPINGADPDGNWFWIDDAIATGLGAVAGYVGYGVATGDWTSGHAWTMAAIGAAAGEGALYTGGATLELLGGASAGVGATLAAGAAGGAVGGLVSGVGGYSAGAAYGDHSFTMTGALTVATISFGTGALSGVAGSAFSNFATTLTIGGTQIISPIARGVITGALGGAAGGYVGGFAGTLLTGGSLSQAERNGLSGLYSGAAMGGVGGGIAGYANAVRNDINPWTGARQTSGSGLGSNDIVCRGGTCTSERFEKGSGVKIVNGKLVDVSVQASPGANINDLTSGLPQKQVGTTTVGKIQALGGTVSPTPTVTNPFHCSLCGITPDQAEQLFTPTIKNPSLGN